LTMSSYAPSRSDNMSIKTTTAKDTAIRLRTDRLGLRQTFRQAR
jgi:hypothetical protein